MINTINNAMARRRAELKNGENDKGFTLIELMVVIIIIGILAAIAIPVFLNQRQQAWEGSVKSDLANAALAAESFSTGHDGSYALLNDAGLTANGFKQTDGNTIKVGTVTATTYVITGKNANTGAKLWTFSSADGKTTVTGG